MNKAEYINIIPFSQLHMWDVKRHLIREIQSSFPLIPLSELIEENNNKVKLNEYPDKEFGILGVNNIDGLFDAYTEKGKKINQSYKKMETNELAYNPYRINVGSIGMKTFLHKNDYISPAYVVFRCNERLNPEYLYKLFKTNTFDKIINENTTGSVRQNLKFDTLKNIRIPLPPLSEQNQILETYSKKIQQAEELEKNSMVLEEGIEEFLYDELDIKKIEPKTETKIFNTISYKEVERWSVDTLGKLSQIENKFQGKYQLIKLRELINSYQYGLSEKSSKEPSGYPMLRMNNINNSALNIRDLKYIKIDEQTFLKYKLNKGDLLFNRTNSKELVGKTALFDIEGKFTFASYLIRVEIDDNKADKRYLNYLFNSSILQYQKNLVSRQITGQANINAQEMQAFLFPNPPLTKQREIADKIESLKDKARLLKLEAIKSRKEALKEFENEIFKKCN
ncbi:Type I restriction enzyme EcoKI specificity protein [Salinivirga cyanobacteriivorans]|uniref:Type I restriction enzyme EcoKI specificity protein n=1 Tax=Salinivirga cyanobacteriivorans TaxID=1307839 RepID=A0A0S2I3H1_9BACT|nr:restriction endonuclease subunit S [Salinivirga cyanobacteriivorans]ALO16816.1 Type I restriction enzyme EcoKI specificity protein [Salinivirga cyanobacteriivorans]